MCTSSLPDAVEQIAVKLALAGCGPEPLFTRGGAVNWRALCPCRGAVDGHSLTVRRALDQTPVLDCDYGSGEELIFRELNMGVRSAESAGYPEVIWGSAV
jgi:hypothetical protein